MPRDDAADAVQQPDFVAGDDIQNRVALRGLVVAVDEFIGELNERCSMHIDFSHSDDLVIPPSKGIHLWRIIHEVIHNADKHAKATTMKIQMGVKDDKFLLNLHDNGMGFDSKDLSTFQKGLGLRNIISRVETLQGNIYIDSTPQRETAYSIEIPAAQTT